MTTLSQPAFAHQHPFLNALAQLARDIIAGRRDGLALQDRYEALSRLSNRELTQRGLTRADIPRLALIESYGDNRVRATGE
jgi:hypothetical protein